MGNRTKSNIQKATFLVIVLLAFCLRFYRLGEIPPGLNWDEAALGYNAYSILKTGKDEYGIKLPLTLRSFGDYKPPLYSYLTIPSIALFGLNEFAVRFPSALFGALTVLVTYFLVKEIFASFDTGSKEVHDPVSSLDRPTSEESKPTSQEGLRLGDFSVLCSLLSVFLLAISPWHLHFSRAGFEANVALFFISLGVLLFVLGIKKANSFLLTLSLFNFVLSLYTYNACRLFVPLFVLCLFVIFRKQMKRFNFKKVVFILSLAFLLTLPFLKFSLSPAGLARVKTESFFPQVNIKKDANIFFRFSPYLSRFFKNYLSHFSFDFLFFSGDQNGRHSVREMGEAYLWQLPFFLFGVYALFKKIKGGHFEKITLSWLFLSPLAASFTKVTPHALRSLFMVAPLNLTISLGILKIMRGIKKKLVKKIVLITFSLFAFYNFISYLHIYWVHYPKKTFLDWEYGFRELAREIEKVGDEFDKILINDYRSPYTRLFLLFYTSKAPPSFSKYHFVKSPPFSLKGEKILYAGRPDEALTDASLLGEIKFPDGNIIYKLYAVK